MITDNGLPALSRRGAAKNGLSRHNSNAHRVRRKRVSRPRNGGAGRPISGQSGRYLGRSTKLLCFELFEGFLASFGVFRRVSRVFRRVFRREKGEEEERQGRKRKKNFRDWNLTVVFRSEYKVEWTKLKYSTIGTVFTALLLEIDTCTTWYFNFNVVTPSLSCITPLPNYTHPWT